MSGVSFVYITISLSLSLSLRPSLFLWLLFVSHQAACNQIKMSPYSRNSFHRLSPEASPLTVTFVNVNGNAFSSYDVKTKQKIKLTNDSESEKEADFTAKTRWKDRRRLGLLSYKNWGKKQNKQKKTKKTG